MKIFNFVKDFVKMNYIILNLIFNLYPLVSGVNIKSGLCFNNLKIVFSSTLLMLQEVINTAYLGKNQNQVKKKKKHKLDTDIRIPTKTFKTEKNI